ncbi:tetraacyldisaccharide 4'-kinase [bacterium BMS3Bbin10]|nr:tetraacyldisaccharide 4'-kinase [bacterium BMS3Bbin10]
MPHRAISSAGGQAERREIAAKLTASAPSWWYDTRSIWPALLMPAALVWDAATRLRWAFTRPFHPGIPVICVGNFTAGGAGKTPAAIAIAGFLRDAGEQPVFLTRGYGGTTKGPHLADPDKDSARAIGDEPLLLARIAPTLVAADRAEGARAARDQGASVIVMDDGFQNPGLAKNLSLAVIDADLGLGNEHVIPAGPLRASLGFQLGKADALVLVGEGAAEDHIRALAERASLPLLEAEIIPESNSARLRAKPVIAFAGIGNPGKFFRTLEDLGVTIAERISFGDHHSFTHQDADMLLDLAARHGAQLVTTEKDMVRLEGEDRLERLKTAAIALPVKMKFKDERAIKKLISRALVRG